MQEGKNYRITYLKLKENFERNQSGNVYGFYRIGLQEVGGDNKVEYCDAPTFVLEKLLRDLPMVKVTEVSEKRFKRRDGSNGIAYSVSNFEPISFSADTGQSYGDPF